MQTQVMDRCVVGVPWLERYAADGEQPQQHPLHTFPFAIGRVETADLQIEDSRVSREHAVILREGKSYRIRDLHSTNGTVLNGQRVQDAPLVDGDILVIADVEFTFYAERSNTSYATATEVIGGDHEEAADLDQARAVIRGVRRLQQALVQRAIDLRFLPIRELDGGRVFAHEAVRHVPLEDAAAERLVLGAAGRLSGRMHQLVRMVAVESAATLHDGGPLLVKLDQSEIGCESLIDSLTRLARATPAADRLVLEIQETAACDLPYFRELHGRVRELGMRIAYGGFAGSKAQVTEKREIPPDFLKLSPALVANLHRQSDRQRQLQAIVKACRDLGCDVIATGLQTKEEARACQELGCRYGQGNLFGDATPLPAPPRKSERKVRGS